MSRPEPSEPIFHILRNGEQDPSGPYSQNDLAVMIGEGQVRSFDYVFYPDLPGWTPISQVFDIESGNSAFETEGQNADSVAECVEFVKSRITPEEHIHYVAVQKMPAALGLTTAIHLTHPRSMVLTSQRIFIIHHKVLGTVEFDEFPLNQIASVSQTVKEGKDTGSFNIELKQQDDVDLGRLPIAQLGRMEDIATKLMAG